MRDERARAAVESRREREWPSALVLAVACVGQFMVVLDISVVNVALPQIRRNLGLSQTDLQWIVNAYTLVFAGFLLLGGRAGDLFGRKRLFLFGLVLFAGASLVGGLAPNGVILIGARAAQGLGGAVLAPATLAIVSTTYRDPIARTRALGIWGAVGGAGGAAGVLLGGVLTEELSWRWTLFINLPVAVAVFVVGRVVLHESRAAARSRLDVPGAVLVTAGLAALVFAIVRSDTVGWGAPVTLATLVVAAVLLVAFLVREGRFAAAPLVPLSVFRSRSISGANLVMLANSAATFPYWILLSLYFQDVRGFSPLRAGFSFLPATLSVVVGARSAPRLVRRFGARAMLFAGPLLIAAGILALSRIGPGSNYWIAVALPSAVASLGLGLSITPVTVAATAGLPRGEAGLASGLLNTSRQVGGSIGIAVAITIAVARTAHLEHGAAHVAGAAALSAGYGLGFDLGAAIAFAGALASFLVPAAPRLAVSAVAAPGRELEEPPRLEVV